MSARDGETAENERERSKEGVRDDGREVVERSAPHVNARPGGHDSELHPDTPETMQDDHEDAPGRQRYADARPGDYGRDFQADGSTAHPVKGADEGEEEEIPDIAATEPPEDDGR